MTLVKVVAGDHPVLVMTTDTEDGVARTREDMLLPYQVGTIDVSRTRAVSIVDLAHDDPRVVALQKPQAA